MSWQLRLLNMQLRLFVRPLIGRTKTPEQAARTVRRLSRLAIRPRYLRVLARPGGLFWMSCGRCAPRRVLLYFHGGGFIAGSPLTHQAMLGELSLASGIEVCGASYPLVQQAPFPAQIDAAQAAWARLRALGYDPQHIVLGGDSAGGGLALSLLAVLCTRGEPPAAVLAFSPWTDLALTGISLRGNAGRDPLAPPERIGELADLFLAGADPMTPLASPLYADFPGCPPVWLAWSDTEILRDDSRRMAARLSEFGAQVRTEVHPDAPHVWPLFHGWLPESRATLRRAGGFVQAALAATSR